jgi:hypothetical protein
MKNMLIIIVSVTAASIAVTLITKSLGFESSAVVGGAVGGVVAAIVSTKLFGGQKK